MSRTALDGFPLGDIEKDFMLGLIRRYSSLYLVEVLGVCIMVLQQAPSQKGLFLGRSIQECHC
jgi:hypothetical protein